MFESECDKVFEEAYSFFENKDNDLKGEYSKSLFLRLKFCAERGDRRCQNQLGIWYLEGIGTEQNYELAYEWFQKAAKQGYTSAFANIGLLYRKGLGVEIDHEKAVLNFTEGAKRGDSYLQYKLAKYFFNGDGVEKDFSKAIFWLLKASNNKHPNAIYHLGLLYLEGLGVEKDKAMAIDLLTKAAELNVENAIKKLIQLFEERKRIGLEYFSKRQFDVFEKAAKKKMDLVSSITRFWSHDLSIKSMKEDSYGVQYSVDNQRLLQTNMYFVEKK